MNTLQKYFHEASHDLICKVFRFSDFQIRSFSAPSSAGYFSQIHVLHRKRPVSEKNLHEVRGKLKT